MLQRHYANFFIFVYARLLQPAPRIWTALVVSKLDKKTVKTSDSLRGLKTTLLCKKPQAGVNLATLILSTWS